MRAVLRQDPARNANTSARLLGDRVAPGGDEDGGADVRTSPAAAGGTAATRDGAEREAGTGATTGEAAEG